MHTKEILIIHGDFNETEDNIRVDFREIICERAKWLRIKSGGGLSCDRSLNFLILLSVS